MESNHKLHLQVKVHMKTFFSFQKGWVEKMGTIAAPPSRKLPPRKLPRKMWISPTENWNHERLPSEKQAHQNFPTLFRENYSKDNCYWKSIPKGVCRLKINLMENYAWEIFYSFQKIAPMQNFVWNIETLWEIASR